MQDLKQRTIRGGTAKLLAQGANFLLRIGALMLLARMLEPKDFGLVGMVTAVVGVLELFKDFGLSTATIQRASISFDQMSTLFWINIMVGVVLSLVCVGAAPAVAAFYHEPRLWGVTVGLAPGFLFNAAGVQHSALLQRQMRFTAMAVVETISLLVSTSVGIGMAVAGYGYWSLVGMTVTSPAVSSVGLWLTASWVPGAPRKHIEVREMMRFGGTVTLNGLAVYLAYNLEKVLLGRFWGAESIGIYGRAYQLVSIPTSNLNSAAGGVAFASLSRLQDDAGRLRSYFLKGYALVLSITLPITILTVLFAHDLIFVFLGPKWRDAAVILRLLAPTILIFAMINPLGWLLMALGLVGRSLKIALVIAPLTISGYLIGLPHGPKGVALAYSVTMALWLIPHIAWCVKGTPISFRDIAHVVFRPLLSALLAGAVLAPLAIGSGHPMGPVSRLLIGGIVFLAIYAAMLLYVMGQKAFYFPLIQQLTRRQSLSEGVSVSG